MLDATEEKLKKHAILSSVGFLIVLPLGALIARYLRTFTKSWFYAHAIIQFFIAGPIIYAGWSYGHSATGELFTGGNWHDRHKRIGLALLLLYLVQLTGGLIIHFFKMPNFRGGRRPPQNYFHAILGLTIIGLAFYQAHFGLKSEWLEATGTLTPHSALAGWIAVIVIFWVLYAIGLAFLPRQYGQEAAGRGEKPTHEKTSAPMTQA